MPEPEGRNGLVEVAELAETYLLTRKSAFVSPSVDEARRIEAEVTGSSRAWVSLVRVRRELALRACITSYETGPEDVDELLTLLDRARAA